MVFFIYCIAWYFNKITCSIMPDVTSQCVCFLFLSKCVGKKNVNQWHCFVRPRFDREKPIKQQQLLPDVWSQKSVLKAEVVDWIVVGSESSLCDNYTVYCLSWGDRLICCRESECSKNMACQSSPSTRGKDYRNLGQQRDWSGLNLPILLSSVRGYFQFVLVF